MRERGAGEKGRAPAPPADDRSTLAGGRAPLGPSFAAASPRRTAEDLPSGSSVTHRLLEHARTGSRTAIERLFGRLLPHLRRWARGRLPGWARSRFDTEDLVQEALASAFRRLDAIDVRQRHALRAYLRESIRNRVRDEVRRAGKVEVGAVTGPNPRDPASGPLERVIREEDAARFRAALARLESDEQFLVVGRLDLGYSYEQLALATGRPSPDAVRVAARRALLHLAERMHAR